MSQEPQGLVDRIDDAVFRVEKTVVATILILMGVVVFFDVVNRVSTRHDGLFRNPAVVAVSLCVLSVLALKTRGDQGWLPKGIGVGLGLLVAQRLFLVALPNGLVWSQTFALSLTLWMGTIGASLATHERRHLAMDVGAQLWPKAWQGKIAAAGHVVTALFAALLVGLGTRSVLAHFDLWSATDGAAGNLSGLPIPKWFPALAIPYGMGMVSLRFGKEAYNAWTGKVVDEGDDTLKQLGISAPAGGDR